VWRCAGHTDLSRVIVLLHRNGLLVNGGGYRSLYMVGTVSRLWHCLHRQCCRLLSLKKWQQLTQIRSPASAPIYLRIPHSFRL